MKKKYPILYIFILIFILVPSIFIFEALFTETIRSFVSFGSNNLQNQIISLAVGLPASFALMAIYRKYIDKESFYNMGFSVKNRLFDFVLGLSIGAILMSLGFVILIALGALEVISIHFNLPVFLASLILMILVAVHEEVITRGYLLNSLMGVTNKYVALSISSLLFGALHLMNPNISVMSFINITLAGFLLGISYLHSKNLWFPMALHFSWNFFQGPILGFEVSGQEIQSLITQKISGYELITGGQFGFEGSIIATILMIITIFALDWFFKKKEALTQKVTIDFSENELIIEED